MEPLITFLSLSLTSLNHAEYLAHMNSTYELLPKDDKPVIVSYSTESRSGILETGVPCLGLSPEFVQEFEKEILALSDVVNESRISLETKEALVHEENRDNFVIYITTRITRAASLPLEAEREAGRQLRDIIKPYINIPRLPVAQESVAIKGMLIDLRKDEYKEYVTTLGLDNYLAELEKENNAYISLTTERTKSRAANKKETGAEIRKRLDVIYNNLMLLAQSYNIAKPTPESATFVKEMNQLISETKAAYARRSKGKKEKEEEKPVV